MKTMKTTMALAAAASLLVLSVPSAMAQGRGMGRRGQGMCLAPGGPGSQVRGQGYGAQYGGWWNRVAPETPEQKAVVSHIADLHSRIRAANLDAARLRSSGAPAVQVDEADKKAAALRSELQAYSQANAAVISSLGLPAGVGICDGTGRGRVAGVGAGRGMGMGYGRGMGMGYGRGVGMGLRNGTGPNMGVRNGTGPNPNCPLK